MKKALLLLALIATPVNAQSGLASYYHLPGKKTASGEIYKSGELTAAHKSLKFGTRVEVTYKDKKVIVRINDRGPFTDRRLIDLSRAAAKKLGIIGRGVARVSLRVL